ncbi:glycoside hydrolase family 3 N-terminal domain-containing protein [Actinomadura sp. DC4]|uniref:glycoside hydrolase family 3 N-terminal domain-containing protein n=1 Tax=Actinomadura sp. DC4 TaxID=3055069 RepID=UPI0025B1D31E|nr:glycoside hydrolase family 3 N-terminal domain-containing protein [Actinomadura sp. DC4]MDN3351153.1 glycoside hydrolase family 3 N-terminal domain-containing protein [Actinomadura sp. DC4]
MNDNSMTRRNALIAGAGAAVATMGLAGAARAAGRSPRAAAALTPEQQAGQRVIYSYSGTTVPQSLLNAISSGQAAGVIFFGDNISSLTQISSVCQQLNEANASSPVTAPLLLMTDQEGGQVRRLPGGPTMSEKQIGQSSNPVSAATSAGNEAGELLASVGMNVNLAPVLDVYRTAGDFEDQYGRSYSKDPAVCGQLGSAFIRAQQQVGVAATAKHFPGLGSATASQNTDSKPVTLNVSAANLRSIDEAPYGPAISAGVKLVMLSWATYPALDPNYPAGLSSTIIQNELRGRLGFTGVTITDSLTANGLTNFGTTAQRAVSAAKAGMDLLLVCGENPTNGKNAVTGLANALRSGQLGQSAFDAARSRVTNLRNSLA